MSATSSKGGSSSKQQENGDVGTGTDRPLKKARFAWQVKGKHHLKTQGMNDAATSRKDPDAEPASSSSGSDTDCSERIGNAEQNLEILGDYLLKQDFNTLDSVINDRPAAPVTIPVSQLPDFFRPQRERPHRAIAEDWMREDFTSAAYYYSGDHAAIFPNEDEHIARWQARQMAKGFVDNTINRVLESWMETPTPMPADVDNGFLALDVAQFINNLPENNSVENEGILMAISAHGLQNPSSSLSGEDTSTTHSDDTVNYPSPSSSTTPSPSIDAINYPSWSSSTMSSQDRSSNANDIAQNMEVEAESIQECSSSNKNSSMENIKRQHNNQTGLNEDDSISRHAPEDTVQYSEMVPFWDDNSDDYNFNLHFMDAAVTFAIQNNGLN